MSHSTQLDSLLVKTAELPVLHAFGEEVTFLIRGNQTGGQFTAFIDATPPGGGPPPHFHEREDEYFYVLEGPVSFLINGEWKEGMAGDTVLAPRGSVHTFKNNTSKTTKVLVYTTPSGIEDFFDAAAREFAKPEGPDMAKAASIAGDFGIRFV